MRYIPAALESQSGGVDLDPAAPGFSIEHIFSQAPDAGWEPFNAHDQDTFVDRLGKLVLLETSSSKRNRANAPYATNQAVQSTGTFITTRQAQMA